MLVGLLCATAAYLLWAVDFDLAPYEDASMMLRYALHVAQGHGIVWNVGYPPVDGVTDFLVMMEVAGLMRLGLGPAAAALGLAIGAFVGLIVVVYLGCRLLWDLPPRAGRMCGVASALFLLTGAATNYIAAYFHTTVFALVAALTWAAAVRASRSGSWGAGLTFALLGLALGLTRPEGCFLAGFMLLSIVYWRGWGGARRPVLAFVGVFATLGSAYFFWRWHHFGHPLPNPFYVKANRFFSTENLTIPARNTIVHLNILFLPFLLGLRTAASRRATVFLAIPVVAFTVIWVLLSNAMNFRGRFQYPVVPIVLISWPALVAGLRQDLRLPRLSDLAPALRRYAVAATAALLAVVLAGQAYLNAVVFRRRPTWADRDIEHVARHLHELRDEGYVLATTNAGLLPYLSQWTSIDTAGLNDQRLAHEGLSDQYMDDYGPPHVIVIHAFFSPVADIDPAIAGGTWERMTLFLRDYAERRGYRLAAVYGDEPRNTHYYYVRPDFPHSDWVVGAVREWWEAQSPPPTIDWTHIRVIPPGDGRHGTRSPDSAIGSDRAGGSSDGDATVTPRS